ncbi:MAG: PAS domain S-box protein [Candidatus Syntrophoarchaeum butanivorans]|nr:MAG: PAS domain S-box protein [Candidatus Syntrophoarchaeum butanivorans]
MDLNVIVSAIAAGVEDILEADTFEDGIRSLLERVGIAIGADRAYVIDDPGSERYDWCKDEDLPERDEPYFNRWLDRLKKFRAVYGDVEEFSADEQELLESLGIKTLLMLPIFVNGGFYGILGFEWYESGHKMGSEELDVLWAASRHIGEVIRRKRIEEAFKDSESLYRTMVEAADRVKLAFVMAQDVGEQKAVFQFVNDAFSEITGYTKDEMVGRLSLFDLIHPDDLEGVVDQYRARIQGERVSGYSEYRIVRKNREVRWVGVATAVTNYQGKPTSLSYFADITPRKRREEELRGYIHLLNSLSSTYIGLLDLDGRLIFANDPAISGLGYEREDVIGKIFWECDWFARDDVGKEVREAVEGVLSGKNLEIREIEVLSKDGKGVPLIFKVSPFLNEKGELAGVTVEGMVITELKRAENALKRSEKRYRTLIENMNEGLNVIDANGYFTLVNEAFCRLLEYEAEELLGMHVYEVLDDDNRKILSKELEKRRSGVRSRYELTWTAKSGRKIPTITAASPIFEDGIFKGSYGVLTDLTRIREAEELYRTIIDAASDAREGFALVQDIDGIEAKHVYVNDYYCELTGYTRDELYQMSAFELIPDDIKDEVHDRYIRKMRGEDLPRYHEFEWVRKDGRILTVGLSSAVTTYRGKPAFLYYFRDVTGERLLSEMLEVYRHHLEDLVEERTRELEQAHEQLRRKERLATIGELSGTFAHEIRNPLGAIKNSVYYLDMVLKDRSEKVNKHLSIMQREISRIDRLISDLLEFSRVKTPRKEEIVMEEVIRGAIEKVNIPEGIEVVLKDQSPPPTVLCGDPDQLERVFMNLLTNALDAIGDRGRIEIMVEDGDEEVVVTVRDTGCGIEKDIIGKIFEPLYTTKSNGIGLGLAICKQIIEAHSGCIEVESEEGVGTTFTLRFPRVILDE